LSILKIFQTLLALIQAQAVFGPGLVPQPLVDALQKVLHILEHLDLKNPVNLEADLADLVQIIAAAEAAVGHPLSIGGQNVLGDIEKYAQSIQALVNGQFVKAFEVDESIGGQKHTFVIGAMLKGGATYNDLYGA
jgi:hypothetical protein